MCVCVDEDSFVLKNWGIRYTCNERSGLQIFMVWLLKQKKFPGFQYVPQLYAYLFTNYIWILLYSCAVYIVKHYI